MWLSSYPSTCVEKDYSFPFELFRQPCQNLIDCKCENLSLNSVLFQHLSLCQYHSLDYCSFVISFEIRKCESSNLVLLFQACFGYSRSLEFPHEFSVRISLSISVKSGGISVGTAFNRGASQVVLVVKKKPTGQCSRHKRRGFNPESEDPLEEDRARQPTPVFLPRESHGQKSLVGYSPRGRTQSDTTETTSQACTHSTIDQFREYCHLTNIKSSDP